MGKEIIKSLKTVRDNITFFEKFNWQIIERGYSLYIYKTNITRSGALVVDCSMNIDLELKLMGFKGAKKMMEMKPKTLTFDFILTQMKNLEKQNVVDPIVDHGAIVQGQISSNVSAAANIPFYGPVANSAARCNECNRTFASSKCLQDHNESKHGPHKCGMCKFGFPTISELHSHVPKCRKKKQALKLLQEVCYKPFVVRYPIFTNVACAKCSSHLTLTWLNIKWRTKQCNKAF